MSRLWRAEHHQWDIGAYLHLVRPEPGEDQAGGGFGFGLEALDHVPGIESDHDVFGEQLGQAAWFGRARVGAARTARTTRSAGNGNRAIHTDPPRPAPGVAFPAGCLPAFGRRALRLEHRAPAAAGRAVERRQSAPHASPGSAAGSVALAVECAPCLAAWLADRAAVGGPAAAAGRAEARVLPFSSPPLVGGAGGAPRRFRIAAGVGQALLPGSGTAGLLGGAPFLSAGPAQLEAGLGRELSAPGASTAGEAGNMPPPPALVRSLLAAGHGSLGSVGVDGRRENGWRHLRHRHGRTAVSSATCRAMRCRLPRSRTAACPRRG